jgi:LCP family protein required for cell wall assembly
MPRRTRAGAARPRRHPARARRRRSWGQRILLVLGSFVAIGCLAAGAGLAYGTWQLGRVDRIGGLDTVEAATGAPENYLIVGSDSRDSIDPESEDAGAFLSEDVDGMRTDTIMVARVDPDTEQMATLSIPRDLWVTIPGSEDHSRINEAAAGGRQQLVNTIQDNLGVPINHYIEVDFAGFQRLVDSVDGVPMYFSTPMVDDNSGLWIDGAGCTTLDGEQALALARARHLEYYDPEDDDWDTDPTGDLGRITRQQELIRRSLDRAVGLDLANPAHLNDLVNVGVENVSIDEDLGVTDLLGLARRFASFGGDELEAYSLPVTDLTTAGGAQVVELDEAAGEDLLNVFRGLPAGTVTEGTVEVDVYNGTGTSGQAAEVAELLTEAGFPVGETGNVAEGTLDRTTVRFAPGSDADADLVARHLTAGADVVEDAGLDVGVVALDVGMDFSGVEQAARPEGQAAGPGSSSSAPALDGSTQTTLVPVPTEDGGVVMAEVPVTDVDPSAGGSTTSSSSAPTTSSTVEGIPDVTTDTTVMGVAPGDNPSGQPC